MDNVISRFRNTLNLIVLMAVLLAQVIGLAVQVKRPSNGGTRLIRVWALAVVTPITSGIVHTEDWFSSTWHNYVWLRGVRKENEELKDEIAQMKMQQIRMAEDANQARRLQLLLGFKEQYISKTLPAQVISTTGSEFSRAIYIDKGADDGVKPDMPVVTPDGIVGKVLRTFPTTSLVLLIDDPTSGAGVILEQSRLQGILKGRANGTTVMSNIMSDEKVQVGERIVTSGGDRVFPKGLPVGTVAAVSPGQDYFLNIRVKPAANLNRLEEVLVVTKMDEKSPKAVPDEIQERRAIDILAERLPTVAPPSAEDNSEPTKPGAAAEKKTAPELTKPATEKVAVMPVKPKPATEAGAKTVPELHKSPTATIPKPALAAPNGTAKKAVAQGSEKKKPVNEAETAPTVKAPAGAAKEAQPQ